MEATIDTPAVNRRMSRAEAAEYVSVSKETLATWAVRGGGPAFIKAGSKVIYLQSDLDAWMNSRRISCTAERS